ncbi:hypothetical protein LUZ60_017708 [Juncus effusus]|nr:hypothetical protein LUZ60_017708 [Juncus effusus]
MLEKIGLPAKPSMRGSNWVIDASHCQGCSSQFTFINRKHHCRRCGGLFCGTCTGQRMVLRGQGDSPVRICEPCKKLEEAERFELRHGHRNRNIKGSSKPSSSSSSNQEDELLAQLLGGASKNPPKLPPIESPLNPKPSSSKEEDEIIRSLSVTTPSDISSDVTPEELRQKAIEEKKLHRMLKLQGKSSDALQAFKRGRELERQADALESALRKNRRLASKNVERNNNNVKKESVKKDDLASELRDLGWNDADLHETGHSNPVSLEGELSQLIGEITKKPLGEEGEKKKKKGIDNSQVIALKRRALVYKKEGKLQEAKEELKKAKVLERELEERLILGDSDESDDELGQLMRELDQKGKKNDDFSDLGVNDAQLGLQMGGFDLEKLLSGGDLDQFGDFDVTNADLNDPSLNSDLKSFGWSDDEQENQDSPSLVHESVVDQVHALKKEAVVQKRAGNVTEAMSLLKKAKLLEKNLQEVGSKENKSEKSETGPDLNPLRNNNNINKPVTKNRIVIQRELLAVKKRALALRREGKVEESERELERGRVLERELEEIDNGPKLVLNRDPIIENPSELLNDEIGETEVSETDMRDPDLNSFLRNLGWDEKDDDDVAPQKSEIAKRPLKKNKLAIQRELLAVKKRALALRREGKSEESERELERGRVLERELQEFDAPIVQIENPNISDNHEIENTEVSETDMKDPDLNSVLKNLGWDENEDADVAVPVEKVNIAKRPAKKSKFAIQRELLAIKKNALALRREGKMEESERELERGKLLEEQLQELDADVAPVIADVVPVVADVAPVVADVAPVEARRVRKKSKGEIQRELLVLKRKALQLRREGKIEEAESEIEKAKELEREIAELEKNENVTVEKSESENDVVMDPEILSVLKNLNKNESADVAPSHSPPEKKVKKSELEASSSAVNRDKTEAVNVINEPDFEENNLKNEILMHKRKAVALKREGRLNEAKEELKQAKLLEKNLEETNPKNTLNTNINMNKVVSIKETVQQEVKPKPVPTRKPVSGRDRFKIQQESLSHKRNALKLRREGKIEESERESELAKSLEAQLEELNGGGDVSADVVVEDLLDPEMMSALRSIGWGDVAAEGSRRVGEREERESRVGQGSRRVEEREERESRVGEGSRRVGGEVERERSERVTMEEEIKREKVRAVGLKRAGKTKEAMEALRNAKMMEKKLGSGN